MEYIEALKRLLHSKQSHFKKLEGMSDLALLVDIIQEKLERELRRTSLKEDTEWECILPCHSNRGPIPKGRVVKIEVIRGYDVVFSKHGIYESCYLEAFLYHFKPKGE